MHQRQPYYAVVLTQKEMEALRIQNENNQPVVPYRVSQLNAMPSTSTRSYQDIPLQHFNRPSTRPIQPVPPNLPARGLDHRIVGINRSLASISELRVNETHYLCDGPCLGAEGGSDPSSPQRRENWYGFNGLPRSKSVRNGIDQRFPRNEAACNTNARRDKLPLMRHNTVACINNIPSVDALNSKRQPCETKVSGIAHQEAPSDGGAQTYVNVPIATGHSSDREIGVKLSGDGSDYTEDGTNKWQTCIILGLIAFVASLAGAAVYSLIGCALVGCKM